jgi:hypothetical protein
MRYPLALVLAIQLAGCSRQDAQKAMDAEKIQITRLLTRKLAFEAFPFWAAAHAEEPCPRTFDELIDVLKASSRTDRQAAEYAAFISTRDLWGTEMKMHCGSNMPPGVKGLGAESAGPDKHFGTQDDIHSW